MSTLTTQSVLQKPAPRSKLLLASGAFFAIMRRDTLVTLREFISFLIQTLLQPVFFLFVFGKVLPSIGAAVPGFAAVLLPGVLAFTVVLTSLQAVTLPLVLDLGYTREIDDRLLAPLPVGLVAFEKVVFATIRGLIAGALIFPLAWWILGSGYQVRGDMIGLLLLLMLLVSLLGATMGLLLGTLVPPEQIGLMFSLIFTPLIFTGCIYYPWVSLGGLKWFQIVTLFNPLTYASEGLRHAMLPTSIPIQTLDLAWVFLALIGACLVFFVLGMRFFQKRVIS